jgi:hypothetical protein
LARVGTSCWFAPRRIARSSEFGAYIRLAAAGDQARASEAWLKWVDDEGYRGLNAGPFELLAEAAQLACNYRLEG